MPTRLVDTNNVTVSRSSDGEFYIVFQETPETKAWRGGLHTYDNSRRAYTIQNLELSVVLNGEDVPTAAPTPSRFF